MSIFEPRRPEPATWPADAQAAAWSVRRQQLLEWLRTDAPSLAPAYEAAVRLVDETSFPARVHLVCHIVRDIYAKLPEVLDGEYRRRNAGEVYRNGVEKVEQRWEGTPTDSLAPAATSAGGDVAATMRISLSAARSVEGLLDVHRALKKQPRSAEVLARALYRRFADAGLDPPKRLVEVFERERRWFTERAHLVRDHEKLPSDEGLDEHFTAFENALFSLVGPYFAGKQEIDAILQQANQ
ncbi:MAG: hypothetical protein ACF8R9_12840 [Phycisphaerales bacterium JB054]